VDHYLREWDSKDWARAYHSLIELGPPILPELERRLAASPDVAFRVALVQLARQMRSADALPLFGAALHDDAPDVWKEALDGLVVLSSEAAIALLEEAVSRDPPGGTTEADWKSWIQEALQQARTEYSSRGGAA
jgi:HEAT repeat protein